MAHRRVRPGTKLDIAYKNKHLMVTNVIQDIQALKNQIASLETEIATERTRGLASLQKQFGYGSADEFIEAFRFAVSGRKGGRGRAKGARQRRKRSIITPAIRARVIAGVKAGKTGSAIAKECKISLPSVHNIKKAAGLVKSR
jgi:hypothetical protein